MNELPLRRVGRGVCDNGDGWAEGWVTLETGGPMNEDNGDGWAEGCVTMETGGPMNELQLRRLGRGVCDIGDGWADE